MNQRSRRISRLASGLLIVFVVVACAADCIGSLISRITLSELTEKADFIVMAQVSEVVSKGDMDTVTIRVDTHLKGESESDTYTFTLVTRGGLKDFDPELKKGDLGVFFLKAKSGDDTGVEKAYWGGIAIFQKNNFTLSPKSSDSKENGRPPEKN